MANMPINLRTPSGARRWLAVLAVAFLAAQFGSAVLAAQEHAPYATVPQTRRELGDLYAGEIIDQTFIIYNEGNMPLEMDRTTTSQLMPSVKDGLVRVSDFRPRSANPLMLAPVTPGLAAPS
jgi:hypothetical protein